LIGLSSVLRPLQHSPPTPMWQSEITVIAVHTSCIAR